MDGKLKKLKILILNTLFPSLCVSCKSILNSKKEIEFHICNNCKDKIKIKPYKNTLKIKKKEYRIFSATSYKNEAVSKIIHTFKYKGIKVASKAIHKTILKPFIKEIKNNFKNKNWIIIPVPLHNTKRKERGFNQSLLISKIIKKEFKKHKIKSEVLNKNLIKIKRTKPQANLKEKERRKNLKNSFQLQNKDSFQNKNIILVDDVFTTGSTIKECLKVLSKAKINKLITITISKT